MKKIVLLHYAYPPNIGGVERLMSEQASILSQLGYRVSVVTGSGKEPNKKISLTELPELSAVRNFNPALQEHLENGGQINEDFHTLERKIQNHLELKLKDKDVIVVHNMLTLIHNLPFVHAFKSYVAKYPQQRVIIWTHDQTFIDRGQVVRPKPGIVLNSQVEELLTTAIPQATYVVISETFRELLCKVMVITPSRVHVIPNGVNIRRFLEIDDSIWKLYQRENLAHSFPVILSPVNMLERKNLDYCLKIVSELRKSYPTIKYVVSGIPSEHRDTQEYALKLEEMVETMGLRNYVFFLGREVKRGLKDQELHDLYDLADIVFYFSKQENFGLPILEATLTKTPIWVSNLEVFREIGGSLLKYVDIHRQTAEEVALQLEGYIRTHPLMALHFEMRTKYSLESLVKNRLVPLIEN